MLRMPALRGELQLLSARNDDFRSLCSAFEDAQATLERLRTSQQCQNSPEIAEYERICSEIEDDILSIYMKDF